MAFQPKRKVHICVVIGYEGRKDFARGTHVSLRENRRGEKPFPRGRDVSRHLRSSGEGFEGLQLQKCILRNGARAGNTV